MQVWSEESAKVKQGKHGKSSFSHEELVMMVLNDEPRKPASCKHCGKNGLQWLHYADGSNPYGTNFRWALLGVNESGQLQRHVCTQYKAMMKGGL